MKITPWPLLPRIPPRHVASTAASPAAAPDASPTASPVDSSAASCAASPAASYATSPATPPATSLPRLPSRLMLSSSAASPVASPAASLAHYLTQLLPRPLLPSPTTCLACYRAASLAGCRPQRHTATKSSWPKYCLRKVTALTFRRCVGGARRRSPTCKKSTRESSSRKCAVARGDCVVVVGSPGSTVFRSSSCSGFLEVATLTSPSASVSRPRRRSL